MVDGNPADTSTNDTVDEVFFFLAFPDRFDAILTTLLQAMSVDDDGLVNGTVTDPGAAAREATPEGPKRRVTADNVKVNLFSSFIINIFADFDPYTIFLEQQAC